MTEDGAGAHWDAVYGARDETALTWFEPVPELSLRLIADLAGPEEAVIDIGAGASRLVDHLLERGYARLTVLDLSEAALATSQRRVGAAAARVTWIGADVVTWQPDQAQYALWHDRAAFHFLTEANDRAAYLDRMVHALRPGGHAILMTFSEDGPERCSNLPVRRYSPQTMNAAIEAQCSGAVVPILSKRHVHRTPRGAEQAFLVSVLQRSADG